jgi:hypothetical protein
MIRRNPLTEDERITLQKARLQAQPGPSFSKPMAGAGGGIQAGTMDGSGVFTRAGLTNLDQTGSFTTAKA